MQKSSYFTNKNFRSALKRIIMGDIRRHIQHSPIDDEINQNVNNFALANCNIFDGINPELAENMIVLVEGGRILDIGKEGYLSVPDDFVVIDLEGQTLMPGIIDSHIHMCSPFTYKLNMAAVRQGLRQVLLNVVQTVSSGVTTVCDMGGPQGFIKEFTKLSDDNIIPGPRFLNSFTLIAPSNAKALGYPSQVEILNPFNAWILEGQVATRPKTIKELKQACYKVKDGGGTHIKITYQPYPFSQKKPFSQDEFPIFSDAWIETIFKIGKETKLVIDIHAPYGDAAEKCVDLAIKTDAMIRIQHITIDRDMNNIFIQKMKDNGFYMIPTIMAFADAFSLRHFLSLLDSDSLNMMPEAKKQIKSKIKHAIELENYSGQNVMDIDYLYLRKKFNYIKNNTQKAHDGKIIGFGTDIGGTYTGFFGRIFSEIKHYLDFGICAFETLKYLTSINAKILGLNDCGVIERGKLADIIGIKGNPLNDINMLKEVVTVIKGGYFLKHSGIQ
jgi:imidazolonepropionase-like amidohydrolase